MTIDAIEADLPWGFHDADLLRYQVDLARGTVWFDLDVPIDEHQETTRAGRLQVRGLLFIVVTPPTQVNTDRALQVDSFPGWPPGETTADLPPIPERCFMHTIWCHGSMSAIKVVAEDASFDWTAGERPASESRSLVSFPGESLP